MAEEEKTLEFRFTIHRIPEGRALTMAEVEQLELKRLEESRAVSKQALWNLVVVYSNTGRQKQALELVKKYAVLWGGRDEQASCWLAMGQLCEQLEDFETAVAYYNEGRALEDGDDSVRYLLHNNLGYSLLRLERFTEAESFLEGALAIDPKRPNAFKNLGLALQGQGRIAEAADHFVLATQADASDARSLKHLEELIARHPDVALTVPGLGQKLDACRTAVRVAGSKQPH